MKRPTVWIGWAAVVALAAADAYLKFHRESSAWIWVPVGLLAFGLGGYLASQEEAFEGKDPDPQ